MKLVDSQLFSSADRAKSVIPTAAFDTFGPPTHPDGYANHLPLGDQGYFYAVSRYRPELVTPLPLKWEVRSDRFPGLIRCAYRSVR